MTNDNNVEYDYDRDLNYYEYEKDLDDYDYDNTDEYNFDKINDDVDALWSEKVVMKNLKITSCTKLKHDYNSKTLFLSISSESSKSSKECKSSDRQEHKLTSDQQEHNDNDEQENKRELITRSLIYTVSDYMNKDLANQVIIYLGDPYNQYCLSINCIYSISNIFNFVKTWPHIFFYDDKYYELIDYCITTIADFEYSYINSCSNISRFTGSEKKILYEDVDFEEAIKVFTTLICDKSRLYRTSFIFSIASRLINDAKGDKDIDGCNLCLHNNNKVGKRDKKDNLNDDEDRDKDCNKLDDKDNKVYKGLLPLFNEFKPIDSILSSDGKKMIPEKLKYLSPLKWILDSNPIQKCISNKTSTNVASKVQDSGRNIILSHIEFDGRR